MLRAWAALAILALLVIGSAEVLERAYAPGLRVPVYVGGMAGLVLALLGMLIALRLARFASSGAEDQGFWKWWGGGLLLRFVLGGIAGVVLMGLKLGPPALLTMAAVYLAGMFVETALLAQMFFLKADQKAGGNAPPIPKR